MNDFQIYDYEKKMRSQEVEKLTAESEKLNLKVEELTEKGKEQLTSYASDGSVKMDFAAESTIYGIGDIVGAKETITGTFVKEKITKKIVTINKGETNIEYEVGEL